ncbi:MAG: DUF3375 domain-containing protein [Treponema sp.]|nr:DUF3375 domain-containing protein [Treponema sp.]
MVATYRRMREQPLWRLLAAGNGPAVIGILQSSLYENERSLPASIMRERIARELEALRSQGEDLPQSAQVYISNWLAEGFLARRFPPGAQEEEYELSVAATEAIRFVSSVNRPHSAATESRLALVIQALVKLAEDTDEDKASRLEMLVAERERIDREIDAIEKGRMRVLSEASALERIREIISLADDLSGDFRRVRDQFEQLNYELREKLIDNEGNRGEVLASTFGGIDAISDSEAGRTFNAFWRMLTDPDQAATLEQALDSVRSRAFVSRLDPSDYSFLSQMEHSLLDQGGEVHEILRVFARSLRHFVQSREYLEQRRLNQLLNDSQRLALTLKDTVNVTETLQCSIQLTSSRIRSLSQLKLYDPSLRAPPGEMLAGSASSIDLQSLGNLVAQSEIDFRTLKASIREMLEAVAQASIGEVLQRYPANQGLGSVIGLVALGSRHGERANCEEAISWIGGDGLTRRARIAKIFFIRERLDELA